MHLSPQPPVRFLLFLHSRRPSSWSPPQCRARDLGFSSSPSWCEWLMKLGKGSHPTYNHKWWGGGRKATFNSRSHCTTSSVPRRLTPYLRAPPPLVSQISLQPLARPAQFPRTATWRQVGWLGPKWLHKSHCFVYPQKRKLRDTTYRDLQNRLPNPIQLGNFSFRAPCTKVITGSKHSTPWNYTSTYPYIFMVWCLIN